jgi:hypothetical protein
MAVVLVPFMGGTVEGLTKPCAEGVLGRDVDWFGLILAETSGGKFCN